MDAVEAGVRAAVAALAAEGMDVEVVDIDPGLADTAEFCAAYGYSLDDSANAIVVVGKSDPPKYAMCVVLATTRLDVNRAVRTRFGTKKASFAPGEVTGALTGMTLGGVTPVGLPADLPLWIDARVMDRRRIIIGGGSRSCKVVGPPEMLLRLAGTPNVEVVPDLALLTDPPS
jgi:prolyl-tRNA editing enzyme YbaK/EbsC (Cys-tRNA(Pro) deacylase)